MIVAATITSVQCPLLGGLLCSVQELQDLIPQIILSNPSVTSVVVGNNQVLGLNLTPEEIQVLAGMGVLTSTCTIAQQVNVLISDPTCPVPQTVSSSSTTVSSSAMGSTSTTI